MIITICTLALSAGAAVLVSYKTAAPKKERVVWINGDNVSLAKEYQELGEYLLMELSRIQTGKYDPSSLHLILKSVAQGFRRAWPTTGYYYKRVETFLEILNVSWSLQKDDPSDEYIVLLKKIVKHFIPKCGEAILRKETGDVTTFSHGFMGDLENVTNQLAACNQRRLSSHSILKAGN
jgi:hypothetical protein